MLSLRLPVNIYWSVAAVDMRKSFDSLSALVAGQNRRVLFVSRLR